jgi:hypothetical protein
MEFNDATLPTGRLCVVFVSWHCLFVLAQPITITHILIASAL